MNDKLSIVNDGGSGGFYTGKYSSVEKLEKAIERYRGTTLDVLEWCVSPGTKVNFLSENFELWGRCISADHWALSSARMIPACAMMGQAAGIAAANPLFSPTEVYVNARREVLEQWLSTASTSQRSSCMKIGWPFRAKKDKISLDHFYVHGVENNVSQLFHNLSNLTFLKIPLSFFVRNAG